MRALLVALLASPAALLALPPATATAGTYVSLGLGTTPSGQGDLTVTTDAGDSDVPQQRLAVGQSLGRVAIEASLARFGIGTGDGVAAGVHARLSVPLDGHLGAYGRIGLERVWLSGLDPSFGESADGMAAGLGLEYKLSAPILGQAAIWGEVNQDQLSLENDRKGGVRMWMAGVSLGI